MGTGKSSVAKILSDSKGYEIVEMDDLIERKIGMSINDIFAGKGESFFRLTESSCLSGVPEKYSGPVVVSTGGGVVVAQENHATLRKIGTVVWLRARPETIFSRIADQTHRPLLKTENPLKTIGELLAKRDASYKSVADLIIDTDDLSVQEVADKIGKELEGHDGSPGLYIR